MSRKICIWCGKEFDAEHPRKKRCPECSELPLERNEETDRIRRLRKKRSTQRAALKGFSIDEVLKALKVYNSIHGTALTYGQFVMLKQFGGDTCEKLSKKKE